VELKNVYPYLVPGLFNPDWESITISIGHGIRATLFEDHEANGGIVHKTISPEQLRDAGLTAEEGHRVALENLAHFASGNSPWHLAMKMIGNPGDAVNFMLLSDHPRAAACLRLPDLYNWTSRLLETSEVCACAPQRESLVILPMRDRTYRESIVGKIRQIEANARRPISFELFQLTPEGVREFHEP
jgi:hypothetical protein